MSRVGGAPPGSDAPARLVGTRAVVMGLGSFGGGLGAARHLARHGAAVLVTDLRPADQLADALSGLAGLDVQTVLGTHRAEDFEQAQLVVANPAVPPDHPLLALARARGARVTSDIELLLETVRARFVCITGTQGKSSTCHALFQLLHAAGLRVHLGGNIGGSLLDRMDEIGPEDVCILELSSYQLAALGEPSHLGRTVERVEAVAVTNVLADHLERHGSVAEYAAAKRRILDLLATDGVALLPADDPRLTDWAPAQGRRLDFASAGSAALTIAGGTFQLFDEPLGRVADVTLPGTFQRANVLVALGLARCLGVAADDLARGLPELSGLAHRMESLGTRAGHGVHDNAVSTTPDSTVSALRSLRPGTCLLLGGRLKDLPLDQLFAVARERVGLAVCFGEAAEILCAGLRGAGVESIAVPLLADAVAAAFERAPVGAEVLFSPACSSFDAFPNFRARALAFRAALPERDR